MNILEECLEAELSKGHLYIGVDPKARSEVFQGQAKLEDAYSAKSKSHRSKFEDGQTLITRNLSQILTAIREGFTDKQGAHHHPISKLTLAQVSFPKNMREFSNFLEELFAIPHFVALELQSFGYGHTVPLITTEQFSLLSEKMINARFLERFVFNTSTTSDGLGADAKILSIVNDQIQNLIRRNNTLKYFETNIADHLDDFCLTETILTAGNNLSEIVLGFTECPSKSTLLKMDIPNDRKLKLIFDVSITFPSGLSTIEISPGEEAAVITRKEWTGEYVEGTDDLVFETDVFNANPRVSSPALDATAAATPTTRDNVKKRKADSDEDDFSSQAGASDKKHPRLFSSVKTKQSAQTQAENNTDQSGASASVLSDQVKTDDRDTHDSGASSVPSQSLG